MRDGTGQEQTIEAELFWKRGDDGRSRVLVRVAAPPDLRGSAFLYVERDGGKSDLFSYLPELGKVRRITGRTVSGSLFGTDFSYEDIARLQSLGEQVKVEKLADAEVAGRATWVLTAPIPPESGSMRKIDGVRSAFVTEVDGRVGAAVVGTTSVDELRSGVRQLLSSFKVPTVWLLLDSDDDVPRGGTGKVDVRRLRELLAGDIGV